MEQRYYETLKFWRTGTGLQLKVDGFYEVSTKWYEN